MVHTTHKDVIFPKNIADKFDNQIAKQYGGCIPFFRTPNAQVNFVTIQPKPDINYQNPHSHSNRTKTCVVISGTMTLKWFCKKTKRIITERLPENFSITINAGEIHEIINEGLIPLVFVEVQTAKTAEAFMNNALQFYSLSEDQSYQLVPLIDEHPASKLDYQIEVSDMTDAEHTLHFEERFWGSFAELIKIGDGLCVKVIKVNSINKAKEKYPQFTHFDTAGVRLSRQYHYHRNEHWIVTEGAAWVEKKTVGKEIKTLEKYVPTGQSTYIQMAQIHRLGNKSLDTDVAIIEIQRGPRVDENDNVRLDDDYGRKSPVAQS